MTLPRETASIPCTANAMPSRLFSSQCFVLK